MSSELGQTVPSSSDVHPVLSFIGGEWQEGVGLPVSKYNPSTGALLASFRSAGPRDVDHALRSAVSTHAEWANLSPDTRRDTLWRIGELLIRDSDEFAALTSLESGFPYMATQGMAPLAAQYFKYYAGWADKLGGELVPLFPDRGLDYTVPSPYGVIAILIPWNGPIVSIGQKVAPALAAGNVVVLKPSELAPLVPARFAALCEEAGLPAGVLNIIPGDSSTGSELVADPRVHKVSFTGSVSTGRAIQASAAKNGTPIILELGGKSANLIFGDADLDQAASLAVFAGTIGAAGQGCIAPTRLLIERSVYPEVVARVLAIAETIAPGDVSDPTIMMGPVITAEARHRILSVISDAHDRGDGTLLLGGEDGPLEPDTGYFVRTAVFGDVDNSSPLAQHEIFGPVLAVMPFEDEDHAIHLANDNSYGLAGYVNTTDLARAHRVARRLDAGYIGVNGLAVVPPGAPFGGNKASGFGREGGLAGILEFSRQKNVFLSGIG
jgi:aldehyde dehydrogenase (NAD+)